MPTPAPLELSTQLLAAAARQRGVHVEVVDTDDNFLRLTRDGRTEYVKQATRTSADTYISALIMENKEVTKRVLREHGLPVPTDSPCARSKRPPRSGSASPDETSSSNRAPPISARASPSSATRAGVSAARPPSPARWSSIPSRCWRSSSPAPSTGSSSSAMPPSPCSTASPPMSPATATDVSAVWWRRKTATHAAATAT
ncbi:MAG: hypothetical protein KA923_07920 [Opitutaceae bacterium]|nr:hypothetical protein [Opitutaceae bacterium]